MVGRSSRNVCPPQWRSYVKCHPVRPAQVSPHTTQFYLPSLPYPFSPFPSSFSLSPPLHIPFLPPLPSPPLPSPPLPLEVDPTIAARRSGERFSSPAGRGGARPPNAFWCIFSFLTGLLEDFMTGKNNEKLWILRFRSYWRPSEKNCWGAWGAWHFVTSPLLSPVLPLAPPP